MLSKKELARKTDAVITDGKDILNKDALSALSWQEDSRTHRNTTRLSDDFGRDEDGRIIKYSRMGYDKVTVEPIPVLLVCLDEVEEIEGAGTVSVDMSGVHHSHKTSETRCPYCGGRTRDKSLSGWYYCQKDGWVHPSGRLKEMK